MFDFRNCSFAWKDSADGEESGLHDGVHASTHACLLSDLVTVDHIELKFLLDNVLLYFNGEVVPDFIGTIETIEQEGSAGFGILEHIYTLKERELVTGNEIRLVQFNEIRCTDGLRTKA